MHLFTAVGSVLSLAVAAVCAPNDNIGDVWQPFQSQAIFDSQYTENLLYLDTTCGPRSSRYFSPHVVLGDLSAFPYVGAGFKVSKDDHQYCASCWKLSYGDQDPIYMLAIDEVDTGFSLSKQAWDGLYPNNTNTDTILPVIAQQADINECNSWLWTTKN